MNADAGRKEVPFHTGMGNQRLLLQSLNNFLGLNPKNGLRVVQGC
jgi:hypothetical protein